MDTQRNRPEVPSRNAIGAATVIAALALAGLVWMQADERTASRLAGGVATAQPATPAPAAGMDANDPSLPAAVSTEPDSTPESTPTF